MGQERLLRSPGRRAAQVLSRNAIPFMLELGRSDEWQSPTKVARAIGAQTKWAGMTVARLRKAGLIDVRTSGRRAGRTTREICLTMRGRQVSALLEELVGRLEEEPKRTARDE